MTRKYEYQVQVTIQDGDKKLRRWVACACCRKRLDFPSMKKADEFCEKQGLKRYRITLVNGPGRVVQGPVVLIDPKF